MKTATILFTYNRSKHAQKVLNALKQNTQKPQHLIIFQDGRKETTDMNEWEAVGRIIKDVRWCNVEVHIGDKNKGLAASVTEGVSDALKRFDAVIVLEDDCVPHPMFLRFMSACLEKYESEKIVYAVGGCPEPIDILREEKADAYFCGRVSSLGWGTWRDRWSEYEEDYDILKRIKNNQEMVERLNIWGSDLESHLLGNISGKCNSWAVFWALKVIEKNGLFLCPYESLITNIGYDGSGVHSGTERIDRDYRAAENLNDFILPEQIAVSDACQQGYMDMLNLTPKDERYRSYQDLLCRWVKLKQNHVEIKSDFTGRCVASWGKGTIFDLLRAEQKEKFPVRCIIETIPCVSDYEGIPIHTVREIPEEIDTVVVIPFCDLEIIRRKIKRWRPDIKDVIGINEIIKDIE